jgi:hypothetical protein
MLQASKPTRTVLPIEVLVGAEPTIVMEDRSCTISPTVSSLILGEPSSVAKAKHGNA